MATNVVVCKNKSRALAEWIKALGKSTTLGEKGAKSMGGMRRRIWQSPGTPSTLQAQYATSPHHLLQVGDLCIDTTNSLAYVCTVEVAASTDATWTSVSVD
jgi:hypothetical protein